MKPTFFRTLLLALLLAVGVTSTAHAQLSIGINGVEFGEVPYEGKKSPVQFSTIIGVRTKPNPTFTIGRLSLSTIPTFEIGCNVLSNLDYSPYAGTGVGDFLDINSWKSTQVTVNLLHFAAYSKPSKFGVTVGLGIRSNDYRLDPSLSLAKNDGLIMPYNIAEVTGRSSKKSKFNIASLHLPVELMFGNPRKFAFSVGGYVDMVMNSHTKIKYQGGKKDKVHNYPVNFIQAGATARLSFRWISIYASYQPTQIFKSGRGPEAQQWTIGIGF